MIKKILIIFAIAIIAYSCECVPDVNGPKVVTPETGAKVDVINVMSDFTSIKLYDSDYIILSDLAPFLPNANPAYLSIGNASLSIKSPDNALYRGFLEFNKLYTYSLIIYGNSSKTKILTTVDTLTGINKDDPAFRIFHLSFKHAALNIKFSESDSLLLSSIKSYSDYKNCNGDKLNFDVYEISTGNILKKASVNMLPGKKYNIFIVDSRDGKSITVHSVLSNN